MKILITGKNGQLSKQLNLSKPIGYHSLFLDSEELDITHPENVLAKFEEFRPDLVINSAAYTAVDKAELNNSDAYIVNREGAVNLAIACEQYSAKFIHISTDYVFDGSKATSLKPNDKTSPLNIYGKSKLAGEAAVLKILPTTSIVIRTSWLYSQYNHNFVKTMLRLFREKDKVNVVNDQIGSPTWTHGLAEVIWKFAEQLLLDSSFIHTHGQIFHWSDNGETTWHDFALAIRKLALEKGLLEKKIDIYPISSEEMNYLAKRPYYSVLDSAKTYSVLGIKPRNWYEQLSAMLDTIAT